MSKLFSISLTTFLVFMNVLGPIQPADIMEDPPTGEDSISAEISQDEAPESDEALETDASEPGTKPVEEEPVVAPEAPLDPADEPEESANAPPIDDADVLSEEAPAVNEQPAAEEGPVVKESEPIVTESAPAAETNDVPETDDVQERPDDVSVSPSAVNPNPGECGGIGQEPCPGGEEPTTVNVTITVTQTNQVSQGATVVVRDSDNAEVGSKVTDADGVVQFDLTAGETYSVDVTKNGFSPRTGVSLTASAGNPSLSINLTPLFGKITVSVRDSVTNEPIAYATVRFTKKPGTVPSFNGNSGSAGQITPSLESGDYVALFSKDGYVSKSFDITIVVGDVVQVTLDPRVQEPAPNVLSLEVIDKATGDPIPNATITLRMPTSPFTTIAEGTTNSNGRWESGPLENIEYDLVIHSPFHTVFSKRISSIPASLWTVELDTGPELTGTYTVLDIETDEPIANARITVEDYNLGTQFATGQTDANGTWTFSPIFGRGYWVTIEKDGYQSYKTYTTEGKDYSKIIRLMPPGYPGTIYFDIYNAKEYGVIRGASITLSNGEATETLLTNDSGRARFESIPSGTYDLSIEANGYVTYTDTIDVSPNSEMSAVFELEPLPATELTVQLQAPVGSSALIVTSAGGASIAGINGPITAQVSGVLQPLAGQQIRLVNPDTNLVIAEGVTDTNGLATISVPRQGTYQLIINVDGFEDYDELVDLTQISSLDITLTPLQVSDPSDPGDDTTPDPDPADPVNPGDGTTPDPVDPGEGAAPGTGNPAPAPGDTSEEGATPDTSDDPAAGETAETEAAAQSAGSTTDTSASRVSQLPDTGTGESTSHPVMAAFTLVTVLLLLAAVGVRRRA